MTGWVELAEGVWTRNYSHLDFNVGVVAGADALAVIDTRSDVVAGRELRDHLRQLSPLPVGWVVNTHYHWDHTWGNEVFTGAALWGHDRCAEEMRDNGETHRARVKEMAPEYAGRYDAVTITPPDNTFPETATLDLGPRSVELSYLGRGHTNSDIVARVAGVTFAGDLVENGAPPAFGDSFPLDWPDAVAGILAQGDAIVVPGHGPVADRAFVAAQHEQLVEIARQATERHAEGMTWEEAAEAGSPFPPQTTRQAFERAYLQFGGGPQ